MVVNVDTILGDVVVMTAAGDTYQVQCSNNSPGSQTINIPPASIYRITCGLGGSGTLVAYLADLTVIDPSVILTQLLTLKIEDHIANSQEINVVAQS